MPAPVLTWLPPLWGLGAPPGGPDPGPAASCVLSPEDRASPPDLLPHPSRAGPHAGAGAQGAAASQAQETPRPTRDHPAGSLWGHGRGEGRPLSTYLPAVQAAHEGEGPAGCAVQLHVVSPQDEVTQLHAVQRLGLGHVQATHKAASPNVNGALAGRGQGLRAQRSPGAPQSGPPPGAGLPRARQASPVGGNAAGRSRGPAARGPPAGS